MATRSALKGISLVEVLVVLTILGILASLAAPGWTAWLQRQRVAGVSTELVTDLQYARSEAVMRRLNTRIEFAILPEGTCYIIHTGSDHACRCEAGGSPTCTPPAQALRTVFRPAAEGVSVTLNHTDPMIFSSRQGTLTPGGTISVSHPNGTVIRHKLNMLGRVQRCTVGEAALGHSACPP